MRITLTRITLAICIMAAVASLTTSCRTKHDLTVFDDLTHNSSGQIPAIDRPNQLEPENELTITVTSDPPEATADFNLPLVNPAVPGNSEIITSPKAATYRVDSNGFINFPRLGKIKASGLTVEQLRDTITGRIAVYVKDPMVNVDLTGYRIVVMGEVRKPGTITTRPNGSAFLTLWPNAAT